MIWWVIEYYDIHDDKYKVVYFWGFPKDGYLLASKTYGLPIWGIRPS